MVYSHSKLKLYSLALLALIGMALLIHFTLSVHVLPDSPDAGLYDFTYYIVVVRDYLQGATASPYRFESQIASLSALYQTRIRTAMPVAVNPTALLIWAPFAWLATFSIPWANTVWLTFSLGVLFFSWQQAAQYLRARYRGRLALYGMGLYLGVFSATMYDAVCHGQTPLLACGLYTLLIVETLRARQGGETPRRWLFYLIFFGLSMKITYLAITALFLFVMGFRADAILATLAVGAATLAVGLWRGMGLIGDYVTQLNLYASLDLPAYYAPSFPTHMNNFTGAWRQVFGPQLAASLSSVLFAAGALAVMGLSYWKTRSSAGWLRLFSGELLGFSCFALFLLFIPHLGAYDELVLLVAFTVALLAGTAFFPDGLVFLRRPGILLELALLFVLLNHKVFPLTSLIWFLWLIKVYFLGALGYRMIPSRE